MTRLAVLLVAGVLTASWAASHALAAYLHTILGGLA